MSSAVDQVIAKFGSQSALASAVGVSQPSVHGWRRQGFVPSRRIPDILKAARARGIPLTHADFFDAPQPRPSEAA